MPLLEPFKREKNQILLTIMVRLGNKLKKIAKGEINLYKKYFLNEKLSVDKYVHLDLYQSQVDQITLTKGGSDILTAVTTTGKVFMKAHLLDPLLEEDKKNHQQKNRLDSISVFSNATFASQITQILKNNIKIINNSKDNISQNKTERFKSVTEHGNEHLRNIKNHKIGGVIDEDLYEDIEEGNNFSLTCSSSFKNRKCRRRQLQRRIL